MKIPRSRLPASTLKPTAFGSFEAGNTTVPNWETEASSSRRAPLPMYKRALRMDTVKRVPCKRLEPASSGSSTPDTALRATLMVALPKATSAIARPTVPPISKVGSVGFKAMEAKAKGDCVQSNTAPLATEVRFSFSDKFVAMIFTSGTPCNWARPRDASMAVNFLAVLPVPTVSTAILNAPFSTAKPTAAGSLLTGKTTVPKVALFESMSKVAPLPI